MVRKSITVLATVTVGLIGCQRSGRPFASGSSFSSQTSHDDSNEEGTQQDTPSSKTDGEGAPGFWIDRPRVAITHKDPAFWNISIGGNTIATHGPGSVVRLTVFTVDLTVIKNLDLSRPPVSVPAKVAVRKSIDVATAVEFQVPFENSKQLVLFLGSQSPGPDTLRILSADELLIAPDTERDSSSTSPLPSPTPTITPTPFPLRDWSKSVFELYKADAGKHLFSLNNAEGIPDGFVLVARRFGAMVSTDAITCTNDNHIAIRRASKVIGTFQSFNYDTWDGGHRRRINDEGWNNDSPTGAFDCLCKQEPGTVPLHKYVGPNEDNFLTLTIQTISGYAYVGPLCFVHL